MKSFVKNQRVTLAPYTKCKARRLLKDFFKVLAVNLKAQLIKIY
jgi:hypothetical protein